MNYFNDDEEAMAMGFPPGMLPPGMLRAPRTGGAPRRFDEYYRCYPVAMLPGSERENVNHGGKVIMPPSALDKLTRLHITYPMLFELISGAKETMTHAGVLEFIAEEGKIYLPYWMLGTLGLEPGDLLQIKSTDLPPGQFVKLQPQDPSFLDISDPKAVLENAFRNFACLTVGDIFTFAYNDSVYEIAVKETKPNIAAGGAIGILETDLSVDFEAPVGYVEPDYKSQKGSGTSTPRGIGGAVPAGGTLHNQTTMGQAIGYANIAPNSTSAAAQSSNFLTAGHRLKAPSSSSSSAKAQVPTPKASTPVAGASTNPATAPLQARKTNGPQPLRLPPGKLFFGYEIKPVRKTGAEGKENQGQEREKPKRFEGQGQTLRGGVKRKGGEGQEGKEKEKQEDEEEDKKKKGQMPGTGGGGRTLRDSGR